MEIISKIGGKLIQDVSAITKLTPDSSTYTVQIGHAGSAYATTTVLALPTDVMLKDMADALVYKGTVSGSATSPGTLLGPASKGYTYKVATAGYITAVKVEVGDMIICNTKTTTATSSSTNFDFIQSNLDPTLYSIKGHKHTVTVSNNTGAAGGHTPSGTVSTDVTMAYSTFSGSNKPAGTISGTYSTTSSTHSHSFTGTDATLSTTYMQSDNKTGSAGGSITIPKHEYTPAGSVTVTNSYTTTTVAVSGSITQNSHSHSFTGNEATITVSYQKSAAQTGSTGGNITVDSHNYTPSGTITNTLNTTSAAASVTGSVTQEAHSHSFTGTTATISVTYKKSATNTGNNTATLNGSIGDHSYTPAGTVGTTISYTSTAVTDTTHSLTAAAHTHSFTGLTTTFSTTYTPAGTISAPTITPSLTNSSFNYANGNVAVTTTTSARETTDSAVLDVSLDYDTENLVISRGTLTYNDTYVKNVSLSLASSGNLLTNVTATASIPTFYGTSATLKPSGTPLGETGTSDDLAVSGTIGAKYQKATGVTATFTGTTATITHSHNLSVANHSHSITLTDATISTSYQPAGTLDSKTPTISHTIGASYVKVTGVNSTFAGDTSVMAHKSFSIAHTHSIELSATSTSTTYTPTGTLSAVTPTINDNRTFKYDKADATPSASFAGTLATLSHTATSIAHTHSIALTTTTLSVNYTPAGTIDSKSVTVSGNITGTFYGETATYTVYGTPAKPSALSTFYGNAVANHTHSFSSTTTSGEDSTTI